jgi:hypothetical protein
MHSKRWPVNLKEIGHRETQALTDRAVVDFRETEYGAGDWT